MYVYIYVYDINYMFFGCNFPSPKEENIGSQRSLPLSSAVPAISEDVGTVTARSRLQNLASA